ncbi:MAG TPA: SDR family oxidoreductase [Allosphingosinicella sp.]|jgi:UDP-glucose 4-epimerase
MKILLTGNMGYVGPAVVAHLRHTHPDWTLDGFDNAYFAHCLTGAVQLPERKLDRQFYGDVRTIDPRMLEGYDGIVQLAAISNDPMGNNFAEVTKQVNCDAALAIARAAAHAGVKSIVYASSCSVYGVADGARSEADPVNPITAYAKSKIEAEEGLRGLEGDMLVTSLRFATACGMSDRLRLDLVLNDFVAGALSGGKIVVLSDGSPWRPLIDVADMARAIEWGLLRTGDQGGREVTVNVGIDEANYQVRDLAEAVARAIPGTDVSINKDAPVDSRSYRVDFGLYKRLAPEHQPQVSLAQSISRLIEGLGRMKFDDSAFRESSLMRLQVLNGHIAEGRLDRDLAWQH